MTSTTMTDPSPSHARRKALREADQGTTMTVMNTFPIEKYYAAVDRLYDAFSVAMDERRLDDAYVLGIRFAAFSIESLPKHSSYKRQSALRLKNAKRVEQVLQQVESVTERMDAEEKVKQRQQQEKRREEEEEEEEERQEQEEEKRQRMEKTKKASRRKMEQSALAKLDAMKKHQKRQDEEEERKRIDAAQKKQQEVKKQAEEEAVARQAEAILAQERKRMAQEAEKLAQQQREQAVRHHTGSSRSIQTMPRQQTPRQQTPRQKTPRQQYHHQKPARPRTKEQRTIELLQETIAKQEERIDHITEVKIPALLCKAKSKLAAGQRKEAMYCVYRKKKWDRNVDVLKAGIFKMETQILHLESAAEDREVAKVMQAATDAMQTIQADMSGFGVDDLDDMNRVMAELGEGVEHDVMFDEDELLSELEEPASSSQRDREVSMLPGSQDLLSLPSVPSADIPDVKEPSLHKAVIS